MIESALIGKNLQDLLSAPPQLTALVGGGFDEDPEVVSLSQCRQGSRAADAEAILNDARVQDRLQT